MPRAPVRLYPLLAGGLTNARLCAIVATGEQMGRQRDMLHMRLQGLTYAQVGFAFGISRQRVQQLIAPPSNVRKEIIQKASGKCENCGALIGKSGHVHHVENKENGEDYNDTENLLLLCLSCHIKAHKVGEEGTLIRFPQLGLTPKEIKELREQLGLTKIEMAKAVFVNYHTIRLWERGKHKPSPLALDKLHQLRDALLEKVTP